MANSFISFSKQFYYAGDTVQAVVYLMLFDNILGSNQITVKVKGMENIKWLQDQVVTSQMKSKIPPNQISNSMPKLDMNQSDSDDEKTKLPLNSYYNDKKDLKMKTVVNYKNIIFKASQILYKFDKNFIPAGQYAFPISFKTGEKFPATYLEISQQQNRKGRIKYELQIFVKSLNNSSKIFQNKQQFILRQTVPLKNNKEQVSIKVTSCGCMDKGTSKIQSYFQKNGYLPGEEATLNCNIDNTAGKSQVKGLNLTLINQIKYLGQKQQQQSFSQVIFKNKLPGIKPGQKNEAKHQIKIDNSQLGPNSIIKSSTAGSKIFSNFFLIIQPDIDGKQPSSKIKLPLTIYPYIKIDNFFRSPPNWNPKVLPVKHIQLGIKQLIPSTNIMNNQYSNFPVVTYGLGNSNSSLIGSRIRSSQANQTPKKNKDVQYIAISNSQIQESYPRNNQQYNPNIGNYQGNTNYNNNQANNNKGPQNNMNLGIQGNINAQNQENISFGVQGNHNFGGQGGMNVGLQGSINSGNQGNNGIGNNQLYSSPMNNRL